MWVVVNYYPSTYARFVYYIAEEFVHDRVASQDAHHPTFYVGRLRPYHHHEVSSLGEYNRDA